MYQPEIWHARRPAMVLYKIDRFLEIFEYIEFLKIYIQNIHTFQFWVKTFFGGKSETAILKNSILCLLVLFICIFLNIAIF